MINLDELEKLSSDPFLVYSFNRETVLELITDIRKLREANGVMKEGLEDCTGGDLASGEGIYKAEISRNALAKAAKIMGDEK